MVAFSKSGRWILGLQFVTDSGDAVTMVAVARATLIIVTSRRRGIRKEYIFLSSLKIRMMYIHSKCES